MLPPGQDICLLNLLKHTGERKETEKEEKYPESN
jgi:hypothetical protein